jgi:septal ring factor EnvC (AmiA/AmiB activator)
MAVKLRLFFLIGCYHFILANESVVNINKKLNNIHTEVTHIQKSINDSKISQQNISKQLEATKNVIDNVNADIAVLNNKKKFLKSQLDIINNELNFNKNQLILLQSKITNNIQALLIIKIKLQQDKLLMSAENTSNNIKNTYLNEILEREMIINQSIKKQINQLNENLNKLNQQINIYNNRLKELNYSKLSYNNIHQDKLKQYKVVDSQIANSLVKIKQLKAKEKLLNDTLSNLMKSVSSKKILPQEALTDSNYKIDSDYIIPSCGKIKVKFGQKYDGIISKGILFEFIAHKDIVSIKDGKVVFVGNLTGLGSVVIIQHANNLVSIYCGVMPLVQLGLNVKKGQVIAKSGDNVDKNLDGIYFELRYKGQAINLLK